MPIFAKNYFTRTQFCHRNIKFSGLEFVCHEGGKSRIVCTVLENGPLYSTLVTFIGLNPLRVHQLKHVSYTYSRKDFTPSLCPRRKWCAPTLKNNGASVNFPRKLPAKKNRREIFLSESWTSLERVRIEPAKRGNLFTHAAIPNKPHLLSRGLVQQRQRKS